MRARDMQRLMSLVERLAGGQRRELVDKLKAQAAASASVEQVEATCGRDRTCPRCTSIGPVRNGQSDGLQRYKCRACGKTFNALTGTPLARLRQKGKWLGQAKALADGLTVRRAAEELNVAPSTRRLQMASPIPGASPGCQTRRALWGRRD
jgi:transposase-like protein